METHWLSRKGSVRIVIKEEHADSLLEAEKIHYDWISCKKCSCKECFLLATPKEKSPYLLSGLHIYDFMDNWFRKIKLHSFITIFSLSIIWN